VFKYSRYFDDTSVKILYSFTIVTVKEVGILISLMDDFYTRTQRV